MFNKYKYKACQCLCHKLESWHCMYACRCDCPPLDKKIKELNDEISELKHKNLNLEAQLNGWKTMQDDDYRTMCFQQERVIVNLRTSIDERIKQLADLIKENEKLKAENDKLITNKFTVAFPHMDELEKQLATTREFHKSAMEENKHLRVEIQKLKQLKVDIESLSGVNLDYYQQWRDERKQLKAQLQQSNHSPDVVKMVERKPHKCPVCNGAKRSKSKILGMKFGLDENFNGYALCETCDGVGVVWEPK